MLRIRSSKSTVDSPAQSARVLPESEIAASSASLASWLPLTNLFADEPIDRMLEGRSS